MVKSFQWRSPHHHRQMERWFPQLEWKEFGTQIFESVLAQTPQMSRNFASDRHCQFKSSQSAKMARMNMNENGIRWCWIDSLAWDCSGSFSAASSLVMPHHVKAKRPQSLVGRARVESWDIGISSVPPCCDSCYMKSNMLSQNSEGLPALLVSTLTS